MQVSALKHAAIYREVELAVPCFLLLVHGWHGVAWHVRCRALAAAGFVGGIGGRCVVWGGRVGVLFVVVVVADLGLVWFGPEYEQHANGAAHAGSYLRHPLFGAGRHLLGAAGFRRLGCFVDGLFLLSSVLCHAHTGGPR